MFKKEGGGEGESILAYVLHERMRLNWVTRSTGPLSLWGVRFQSY